MNYLELRQEVEQLQKQIAEKSKDKMERLRVVVISDMPLQPWFDLYLQKAWGEQARIVEVRRVAWEQRRESLYEREEQLIYWPSGDAAAEILPGEEIPGIWISPENVSDPIQMFYAPTIRRKDSAGVPAEFSSESQQVDLEKLMQRVGLEESLAQKESRWGDVYSESLQKEAAYAIVRMYETEHGRRKKCLVLDCDGVLWGGILSEDGIEGIQISEIGNGKLYYNFQRMVKQLQQHGIILAICSKNEDADVKQVFCSHTAMKLQEEDIAAWSVNWKPKSQQMAELAEKLQIDLQDMVLVDDNQWELDEVTNSHPQVKTVLFDKARGLRGILAQLAQFFYLKPEDQNAQNQLRLQTYADNVRREKLRESTASYEEFLEKLQTKIEIRTAAPTELLRISDLNRRVNQCTNGIRYQAEELRQLVEQGYQLQAVYMADIYRNLGLVGCIGIELQKKSLDLFCLSCRALGRKVEQQLLAAVPPEIVHLRWRETGKNEKLWKMMQSERRWENET